MSRFSFQSWMLVSAVLGSAIIAPAASANEVLDQVSQYSAESPKLGQVTSISQLRDVQPTDWAFQALQSLVERYGCIAGYPDGTYRGNRAMTRYEFAAGLNACLDRVNELIASATADLVTKEDLAVLQRLQEEFQAELATLRGRVDALEARTAELEANQFSTTTKLQGQAIFDLGGVFSGSGNLDSTSNIDSPSTLAIDEAAPQIDSEDELTLGGRVRLRFNTSFTGKDLLRTRLEAGNIESYAERLTFRGADATYDTNTNNAVNLSELYYRFPVGNARVFVGVLGNDFDVIVPTTVSYTTNYAFLEQFQHNPAIYEHDQGAGVGVNLPLGEKFNISAAYLGASGTGTGAVNLAGKDQGLTDGANSAALQLTFTPNDRFVAALSYVRTYDPDGAATTGVDKGTGFARRPFGQNASTGDHFGLSAGYKFSPAFNISGWVGWSKVRSVTDVLSANGVLQANTNLTGANAVTEEGEADIFNWALTLGFPDLFREGNYGGFAVGALPYVTDSNARRDVDSTAVVNLRDREDDDVPLAFQVFYSFKVSDNVSIQPQVFYITNPNGSDRNDNIWAGSVKTTFSF